MVDQIGEKKITDDQAADLVDLEIGEKKITDDQAADLVDLEVKRVEQPKADVCGPATVAAAAVAAAAVDAAAVDAVAVTPDRVEQPKADVCGAATVAATAVDAVAVTPDVLGEHYLLWRKIVQSPPICVEHADLYDGDHPVEFGHNLCNTFCICCQTFLCGMCLLEPHSSHDVIKLYQHKFVTVLPLANVPDRMLSTLSSLQTYLVKKAPAVYLKSREGHGRGNPGTYAGPRCICKRRLIIEDKKFCSIGCMLASLDPIAAAAEAADEEEADAVETVEAEVAAAEAEVAAAEAEAAAAEVEAAAAEAEAAAAEAAGLDVEEMSAVRELACLKYYKQRQ